MLTGAAWGLAVIVAGLLVLLLAVALHAWERTVELEVRVERVERAARLLAKRPTAAAEVEAEVPSLGWWRAS